MLVPTSAAAILLFVFVGGFILPLPHDAVIVLAGYYASASGSNAPLSLLAAILATITADTLLYGISRVGGPLVARLRAKIPKIDGVFSEKFKAHSGQAVFFSRFIMGLRLAAPVYAGSTRMPLLAFELYNGAAVLIYVPVFFLIGYGSHNGIASIFSKLTVVEHVVAASIVITIAIIASFLASRALLRKFSP